MLMNVFSGATGRQVASPSIFSPETVDRVGALCAKTWGAIVLKQMG